MSEVEAVTVIIVLVVIIIIFVTGEGHLHRALFYKGALIALHILQLKYITVDV